MPRYIDADEFVKRVIQYPRQSTKTIGLALADTPTADVQEMTLETAIDYLHKVGWMQEHDRILTESAGAKQGKWIEYNYPGAECVYCSKCKEEYYPDDLLLGGNDYPNFCPNCGADMRGGTDG